MLKSIKKISLMSIGLFFSFGLHNSGGLKEDKKTSGKMNKEVLIIEDGIIEQKNEYIQTLLKYPIIKTSNHKIQNNINTTIQNYIKEVEVLSHNIEKSASDEKDNLVSSYYCATDYVVTYNNNNLLSITMVYADYTGGTNGVYTNKSFNFDLTTGNLILLPNLFKDDKKGEMLQIISNNITNSIGHTKSISFEIEKINESTQYYLGTTYIEIYFNIHTIENSTSIPSFKIPFSTFNSNLKFEALNDENYKYNDGDIVTLLSELASYEDEYISYIYDPIGYNINKTNSDIEMIYTAAKFINDNYYVYYINQDELLTFIYHVYGKKIDIPNTIKNYNIDLHNPQILEYKQGLYYFHTEKQDNSILKLNFLEKTVDLNNVVCIYGIINNTEKLLSLNNTEKDINKKIYVFKLKYKNTEKSILKLNIISYEWGKIDYCENILKSIKENFS